MNLIKTTIYSICAVMTIGILYSALHAQNEADKKYCMEQTRYEFNDCIVMLQG